MTCTNLVSVKDYPKVVKEIIDKEIALGRIAGPFNYEPLGNLRLSPIGVVAKKNGGWRLIHHLSYPFDYSVNDFIDTEACSVHYTSFDEVLDMIAKLGTGAFLSNMDVKSAFRLLPVNPSDHQLLGFKFNNLIMIIITICVYQWSVLLVVPCGENLHILYSGKLNKKLEFTL